MRPCPLHALAVLICAKTFTCDTAPDAVQVCKAPRLREEGGLSFLGLVSSCLGLVSAKPKQLARLLTVTKQSH